MSFRDLHEFVSFIDKQGDLVRVPADVNPFLEVAAIIDRVSKGSRKTLFFENVKGSRLPLVANLFGSLSRVSQALGVSSLDSLTKRIHRDLAGSGKVTADAALEYVVSNAGFSFYEIENAACFEKDITDDGLTALPALQSWPGDGGKYLTLAQIVTCSLDSKQQNCGIYRVQVVGNNKALLRCHPGSGGAAHMSEWHARGKSMPVSIVLGGPPSLTIAAATGLPLNVEETGFAAYLTGMGFQVTRSRISELVIPATAEIVIEGLIHPQETGKEGPFGNHTGSYAAESMMPVIDVKRISMSSGAIYPCTVVGPPPTENIYLGVACQRLMLPLLQHDCPWVNDVHMPNPGVFNRAAIVSVTANSLQTRDISEALLCTRLLRNAKLLIIVDGCTDTRNYAEIYWKAINVPEWRNRLAVEEDTLIVDARDASNMNRVVIDEETCALIDSRWYEYGLE